MVISFLTQRTAVPQGNRNGLLLGFRGHNTNFAGYQSATDRSACKEPREEADYLPDPDVLAQEIVEDLEATFRGSSLFEPFELGFFLPRMLSAGNLQRSSHGHKRGLEPSLTGRRTWL
jgi:hypothetical protein